MSSVPPIQSLTPNQKLQGLYSHPILRREQGTDPLVWPRKELGLAICTRNTSGRDHGLVLEEGILSQDFWLLFLDQPSTHSLSLGISHFTSLGIRLSFVKWG